MCSIRRARNAATATPAVSILACNPVGTTCTVQMMPALCQTDPRIDTDVTDMGPPGCYDTSIVSVAIAALANRKGLPSPAGRTAESEPHQITDKSL